MQCFTRLVSLLQGRLRGSGGARRRCSCLQWDGDCPSSRPAPHRRKPHAPSRPTAVSRIMRACVGPCACSGSSAGIDARGAAAHRPLPIETRMEENTEMSWTRALPNRIVSARSLAVAARAVIAVPVAGCAPPAPNGQTNLYPPNGARFKYPERFAPVTGAIGRYALTEPHDNTKSDDEPLLTRDRRLCRYPVRQAVRGEVFQGTHGFLATERGPVSERARVPRLRRGSSYGMCAGVRGVSRRDARAGSLLRPSG
jgi:hypothetical protein